MPELGVKLGSLKLKNPVMNASGTLGNGLEYQSFFKLSSLGALVTKTLTFEPRNGNPPPRLCETASGFLNSVGLQNRGTPAFIASDFPVLKESGAAVIASVGGRDTEEYLRSVELLNGCDGLLALEINISCPNVKKGGIAFGKEPETAAGLVSELKKMSSLPLIIKLTPYVKDITEIALAAAQAGADALSLINTFPGLAIDLDNRSPDLGGVTGGLSGPALKPIALKMVYDVCRTVNLPVIGVGGIYCARDALEFIVAGATAVQVGSANFLDPEAMPAIIAGIGEYLEKQKLKNLEEVRGTLTVNG